MNKYLISTVVITLLTMMLTLESQAAKFYRFLDQNGKWVIASILPPDASQKGYEIVDEMGVVMQTVSARKTHQQLREERADRKKLAEEQRKISEQKQFDNILINSYTDISDIERARDRELESKERDIILLKQNTRRLIRLLEGAQTRAAGDERLGREVSKAILDEINHFKKRIADESDVVLKVQDLKNRIGKRYNSSIIRFNELKAAEQLRRFRQGNLAIDETKAVIYQCNNLFECDVAWQKSLLYANEYSTTELAWANETTVMMRKPYEEDDISILLTRVNDRNTQNASLVMEVRCQKSQRGEALCQSETVRSIKDGFIAYLN